MTMIYKEKGAFREIVYQCVGAGAGVLFMDTKPDYVFPSENVIDAVEEVLEELCPDAADPAPLNGLKTARGD